MATDENIKYFRTEGGGIVKLVNDRRVYSLTLKGTWIPNQPLITLFIDDMEDYEEITEIEVLETAEKWKKEYS